MSGLRKIVNLAIFALGVVFVFFDVAETPPILELFSQKLGCKAAGGKWANAQDRCVTRACYTAHNCGYWSGAYHWRSKLAPGDPVSEVVFWLGEPEAIDGDNYYWDYGKGSKDRFSATIRDGRLIGLRGD